MCTGWAVGPSCPVILGLNEAAVVSNVSMCGGGCRSPELRCFYLQDTSLADLLQLHLHCYEEDVRGIVDKAVKELGMEKVLSELHSTWTGEAGAPWQPPAVFIQYPVKEVFKDQRWC